ncbi:hypothetical protein [Archangium lipolyticum]|uniref:hypothetical protein n=1 Tax=Archangium lipolyticum TaxID=2970465 RepID=UPI00214A6FB8|nr:hypothetical protein [Archangium lipolyticum]
MRKMMWTMVAAAPLLMATECQLGPPPADEPQSQCEPQPTPPQPLVDHVELIWREPDSGVFVAYLVDVRKREIVLAVEGKGTQFQQFQQQVGSIAAKDRLLSFYMPLGNTGSGAFPIKPPQPPTPPGHEDRWRTNLVSFGLDVARQHANFMTQPNLSTQSPTNNSPP